MSKTVNCLHNTLLFSLGHSQLDAQLASYVYTIHHVYVHIHPYCSAL